MSNTSWEQFKKNWVSFSMTALLGLTSFTTYKIDKFIDRVDKIEKDDIVRSIVDSIQTNDIREMKIQCKDITSNIIQQEIRIQKLEAILPKNKYKNQNNEKEMH